MADYQSFWGNEDLSDVVISLFEESEDGSRKRKRDTLLPAHKVVLAANSQVLKAKVVNWIKAAASDKPAASADKPQIEFEVPAGQLEVGECLLKAMYQHHPDLAGVGQIMMLQLLVLADRYQVQKVVTAVNQHIQQLAPAEFEWFTVQAVYELPTSCREMAAFATVCKAAEQKIQEELGDLELVWADWDDKDSQKQQYFLSLPYAAMQQLLSSTATKVSSENTIAYSIIQWAEKHKPSKQQLKQLVSLVLLPHCTPSYIATVISKSSCFTECLQHQELHFAALCCTMKLSNIIQLRDLGHHVLRDNPSWAASKRPESTMTSMRYQWNVSLTDIEGLFDEVQEDPDGDASHYSQSMMWQGVAMYADLSLAKSTEPNQIAQYELGLYLATEEPAGVVARATYELVAHAAGGRQPAPNDIRRETTDYFIEGKTWGYGDFFDLGAVSDWMSLEQRLRDRMLLHADNCIHLTVKVTAMK